MIPTNNGSSAPCNPISSNCVIWQGPDIPCINLCNGDTISEVIAKLAQELCDIIDATCDCNPDLRELKLNCIPPPSQENPDLAQYLNAIIDYVCAIPTGPDNIIVELPDCLHYDNAQGNPVTALPIDEYALYLANTICDILDAIAIINNQITDIINRLVILEACVLPCDPNPGEPTVTSSCLLPSNNGGQGGAQVPASTLLLALETAFCSMQSSVGSNEAIATAINLGSCIPGTKQTLSDSTVTYGSLNSWINNPQNLANSNANQWNVICDLYSAVADIQANCCDSACDGVSITFSHQVNTNSSSGLANNIVFNFTSSTIPSGLTDCGSSIKITDAQGNAIVFPFDVVNAQTNPTAVTIPLGAQGLSLTGTLTAIVGTCVSDRAITCQDQQTVSIPLTIPCPTSFSAKAGNQSGTDVIFVWNNALGTSVTYDWEVVQVSTGSVYASGTISNPGQLLQAPVTGLLAGENYTFQLTITDSAGGTVFCSVGSYSVPGISCTSELISLTADNVIAPEDIYLGCRNFGDGKQPYYYDVSARKIIQGQTYNPNTICKNPKINIDSGPTNTGDFDIAVDTYNAQFGDIVLEYSNDMINWTGYTGNPITSTGVYTVQTGYTDGSVYFRAQEQCQGSPTASTYAIIRFDYNTLEEVVYANTEDCPEPYMGNIACPTGVWVVNDGVLDCEGTTYPVPSGIPDRSRWYYVGKLADIDGSVKYVYGGWTHQGQLTAVVLCCECPAFVMPWKGKAVSAVGQGKSIQMEIPYLLGDGTPQMNVITPPLYGSLTQNATDNNKFVYTHNGLSLSPGDTFVVEITSTVQGVCNSAQGTVPIQIIINNVGGGGGTTTRGDVTVFVNTTNFNTADAQKVKDVVDALEAKIISECPDWDNGSNKVFTIPVNDNETLGYAKSLVDAGASASLDPSASWTAIADLPPDWTGGAYNNQGKAFIVVMSNASAPQYHDNVLSAGWGAFPNQQPKANWLANYDEWNDILEGSANSAWGISQNFDGNPPFENGIEMLYLPLTTDNQGATAANLLQLMGAYVGRMLNPSEYGIQTNVDLSSYMMHGLVPGALNPYLGAVTAAGTTIEGLYQKNVTAFLNQGSRDITMADLLDQIKDGEDEGSLLDKAMVGFKSGSDTCPVDPPAPANYWEIQKYSEECVLEDIKINIKENPVVQLAIGNIVKTVDSEGIETCWEVIGEKEDGLDQAYTRFDSCDVCKKSLEEPLP